MLRALRTVAVMAAGAEAAAAAGAEQQQRPPWVPPPASWRPPEPAPLGPVHRPYPGPTWNHPRIHQSPDCLHDSGWHDMAGAITFNGLHHAFQGCPSAGGWSHSISSDYVHWRSAGRDVHQVNETYMGMESDMTPCSGFVTVDDDGRACAGFRQCRSWRGTTSLNPAAKQWDVPMEIRCAANDNLTRWGAPEYLFPIYYYRHLPYDPPRPWHDKDGKWYLAWSSDGCNETTRALPCAAGGRLELLSAPSLRGPWTQLPPMFTTNTTCSAGQCQAGALDGEFVTTGFIGGLPGDPDGGLSRVVTQNRGGATFWVGAQANGGKFQPYWDKPGAVGHYDYGDLTMARTLGSDPNQVAKNGRRVLLGWIGAGVASQSLARDLTLSADHELLQAFVPELQMLRQPKTFAWTKVSAETDGSAIASHSTGSFQMEIIATFRWADTPPPVGPFGFTILGGLANVTIDCAPRNVSAEFGSQPPCQVVAWASPVRKTPARGPLLPLDTRAVTVHTYVDGEIMETIANNRTAMVTYHKEIPSASSTGVSLFGAAVGVEAELKSWSLTAANNFGPQP